MKNQFKKNSLLRQKNRFKENRRKKMKKKTKNNKLKLWIIFNKIDKKQYNNNYHQIISKTIFGLLQ